MNIHEYQAKELLAKFGVAVPQGGVAYTADEAIQVARRLGGSLWVVKAQIHAGGRGKAGGVKLARSEDEVAAAARAMLGQKLVTHQTGPEGREVKRVYVEEGCEISRELYLGLLIDRATPRVTLIGSTEGGAEIAALRDEDEEDPAEIEAGKHALNYIKLDGNIGCMVNGAGLAMATMDIIKLHGGNPANFLDVGGGATRERVATAFKLILSDPNVEGILVNIFGGIMRCDVIAEGVVAAAREVNLHVPLVVRLEGTNVDLGKRILQQSGLPILAAENLVDAAEKVVAAVKEAS